MPSPQVHIQVDPRFQDRVRSHELKRIALEALRCESAQEEGLALTAVITDDETLRALNHRHRGIDEVTDVLSFPGAEAEGEFVPAPGETHYLGDVVISYPRAAAQAEERGSTVAEELRLLVVHGVLHLLGYEDKTEEGRAEMWGRQRAILEGGS